MSAKLEELRARFAAHKEALERWSEWCPNRPWAKQREFMGLAELEALYGGAAGGGKTDALLADALQWAHVPGYSAIFFRRTFSDLNLPDAPMDRSHKWLDGTRARWSERDKQWALPTTNAKGESAEPATLQFAFCQTIADVQRYKSAAFQRIYIDELTEWQEAEYTYLFSRIRRKRGVDIPLAMRAATNPDGPGYGWVRERFGIPENVRIERPIRHQGRVFLPARAEDNPSLDLAAYETTLEQLAGGRGGVKWKQLRDGIWIPDGAGLVYVHNAKTNTAPALHWQRERYRWHFILGIDYGYTNNCGFAVIGWRDGDPHVYVLEAFTMENLLTSAANEVIRGLENIYGFERMVGDVGGIGKVYVEEGRQRWTLPIEPAKKENKRGYQVLFNDALGQGHIKLVEETTKDLRDEWSKLPWDPQRKAELKGFANHASDATLYAWREAPNYHERAPEKPPAPGSPEALAAEERRIEQAIDDELEEDEAREREQRRGTFYR